MANNLTRTKVDEFAITEIRGQSPGGLEHIAQITAELNIQLEL